MRGRLAGIAAGLVALALLPAAANAGNDAVTYGGLTYVSTYGAAPAGPQFNEGTVACQTGGVPLSGGFFSNANIGEVFMQVNKPNGPSSLDYEGWRSGWEGVTAGGFAYTIRSVCTEADPPSYPDETAQIKAETRGRVAVKCTGGEHVYGAGVEAGGQIYMASSYPFDSKDKGGAPDDGWKLSLDNPGETGKVGVRVIAACGDVKPTYIKTRLDTVAYGRATALLECPGPTPAAIGGGQKISGGFGDTRVVSSMIENYSIFTKYGTTVDSLTEESQKATTYAVCALASDFPTA